MANKVSKTIEYKGASFDCFTTTVGQLRKANKIMKDDQIEGSIAMLKIRCNATDEFIDELTEDELIEFIGLVA